jgi:hypothetical protein
MRLTPILLAALGAALLAAPARAQEERRPIGDSATTWRGRVPAGAWLRVFTVSGPVDVRETSGSDAQVRAERRWTDGRQVDATLVIVRDGDNITVCALRDDGYDRCDEDGIHGGSHSGNRRASIRLTVLVPRGIRVHAGSGNGEVELEARVAEAHVSSGNGRVRVSGVAGPVSANSGNGDVTVDSAGGPVSANTGNGRVRVSTAVGPVSANSGNGDIDVSMRALRGTDANDMRFNTGNGDVRLYLPASFEGEIETHQGHGELRTDFPLTVTGPMSPSHIRATIGKGGPRLRVSSGNGDVELRKIGA